MRTLLAATLATILTGCVPVPNTAQIVLDALNKPLCDLTDAVIDDGGPRSRGATRNVVAIYEAGVDKGGITC